MTDRIAVTRAGLEAQTATEDDDVPLVLLTLSCPDFDFTDVDDFDAFDPGVMRFVANEEAVLSNGETYLAWGFDYVRPSQGLAGKEASLRMDNVDRRITHSIKLLPSDAEITCRVDLVLSGDPDIVEHTTPPLLMSVIDFNEIDITGTIGIKDDTRQPLCSFTYSRLITPGLHA